jgi:cytochrome c oxidase subunit 2
MKTTVTTMNLTKLASSIQRSRLAAALVAATFSLPAMAVNDMPGGPSVLQLNLPEGVTRISANQLWLHNMLLWVCLVIFVGVFGVMFYSVFAHRKSRGAQPASFHESTTVEIVWTVIPFIIVVVLGAVATSEVIAQKDTSHPDVTVKAVGYQWKWGYEYVKGEGEGISFLSTLATPRDQIDNRADKTDWYLSEVDNPMVVPVDKKIRVVTTAQDVIHAWWVPAFGAKQDAIPGFVRDTWFRAEKVGRYHGYCAELCGKDHAFMPIVVDVLSAEDYSAWVDKKQKEMLALADDPTKEWTQADLVARGEKVYAANCVACHQANGQGVPNTFPALAGSPVVTGDPHGQIDIVLKGKPGTAMASFAGLSDVELAAVITYTRNAWGNEAEQNVVQPSALTAAR